MRLTTSSGRPPAAGGAGTRAPGRGGLPAHALDRQPVQPGAVNRLIAAVVDPLGPAHVQAGAGAGQGASHPLAGGSGCGRREWREPRDWWARRPLPGRGNCTLLASWSEAPELLWQRLATQGALAAAP